MASSSSSSTTPVLLSAAAEAETILLPSRVVAESRLFSESLEAGDVARMPDYITASELERWAGAVSSRLTASKFQEDVPLSCADLCTVLKVWRHGLFVHFGAAQPRNTAMIPKPAP